VTDYVIILQSLYKHTRFCSVFFSHLPKRQLLRSSLQSCAEWPCIALRLVPLCTAALGRSYVFIFDCCLRAFSEYHDPDQGAREKVSAFREVFVLILKIVGRAEFGSSTNHVSVNV
jgi:hypothetical protein